MLPGIFQRQAFQTARYCFRHTSGLDSDFLILSPIQGATLCYAVLDGQTPDPDGRIITKQFNQDWNYWELEIQWEL